MKNLSVSLLGLTILPIDSHQKYHADLAIVRASEAARSQALHCQNPETYLNYQSKVLAIDVQASYWDLEPDLECLDME